MNYNNFNNNQMSKNSEFRPKSTSRLQPCSHKNNKFQTKYKNRNNTPSASGLAHSYDQEQVKTKNRPATSSMNRGPDLINKRVFTEINHHDDIDADDKRYKHFDDTKQKLKTQNYGHHDPELCVCEECDCGRHFCKLHTLKPDLSKTTIYQKDYLKKKPIKNQATVVSGGYDRLRGPNLTSVSTYLGDYSDRDRGTQSIDHPRPKDTLKTEGPLQNLTCYSSLFPGYHGGNQYIRYKDQCTRGPIKFRARSTYSRAFKDPSQPKDQKHRIPDNLKSSNNWFGATTYSSTFHKPNPENYAKKYSVKEKTQRQRNPDDKNQFDTVYRNSFTNQELKVCPAKLNIEKKLRDKIGDIKAKLRENSDFKAMTPNFQAISTSKICYV